MLTFTHEGQTVDVDLDKLPLHEGLALQKATGLRMPEFFRAIEAMDMEALAALGWVLVKFRIGKADVTFEDVCEGRCVVNAADFSNPQEPEGNGQGPRTGAARAKTRTPGA